MVIVAVVACLTLKWMLGSAVKEDAGGEDTKQEVVEGSEEPEAPEPEMGEAEVDIPVPTASGLQFQGQNYTLTFGRLMLINPIFTVGTDFIAASG